MPRGGGAANCLHVTHLHADPPSEPRAPPPRLQVRVGFAQNRCCGYPSPCQGHKFPQNYRRQKETVSPSTSCLASHSAPVLHVRVLEAATKVETPGFWLPHFFTALLHDQDSPSSGSATPAGLSRPLWAAWDPLAVHIIIPPVKGTPSARHQLWKGCSLGISLSQWVFQCLLAFPAGGWLGMTCFKHQAQPRLKPKETQTC